MTSMAGIRGPGHDGGPVEGEGGLRPRGADGDDGGEPADGPPDGREAAAGPRGGGVKRKETDRGRKIRGS